MLNLEFGNALDVAELLAGPDRQRAASTIIRRHYTRSVPSGKSHYLRFGDALVVFSIPANLNIAPFILGYSGEVWELSRLWAPDGHAPNLLTATIKHAIRSLRIVEPGIDALVSYADPNAGHTGGVYRAASWIFHGQSEESRGYVSPTGEIKPRRAFHSGRNGMTRADIEGMGYTQTRAPGKLRFVKPLTHRAKRAIHPARREISIDSRSISALGVCQRCHDMTLETAMESEQ